VSHHIIFITACAQNVFFQHERHSPTARSIDNRVTENGSLTVNVSFQFGDVGSLTEYD